MRDLTFRTWPFEQAKLLVNRIIRLRLEKQSHDLASAMFAQGHVDELLDTFPALRQMVTFQCGYGASGLPHMGTFGEVARPSMVRSAFQELTNHGIPTRLIVFSDDMDAMRRIPDNVPNRELLELDLNKPVTSVRDPFGLYDSFGAYNNARLLSFLDGFKFDYEFMSATDTYRSGQLDEVLLNVLANFDSIQDIILPTLGEERRATYSPFLPISPVTGHVLQVPTLEHNVNNGTIVFRDEDGSLVETTVTGGNVKLQWRLDWAARWVALGVDYEMSGKDLADSVRMSTRIARVLGATPPETFYYELFMDEDNHKISKSKGNGLTMEQWLRYGTPESLSYYMYQSPKTAKRLYFDVIPKAMDEYIQHLDNYNSILSEDNTVSYDNPVWHIHGGSPPSVGSPLSFSLLLNLVSVTDSSTKEMLYSFINHQFPHINSENYPLLDNLVENAIHYYEDFVEPSKCFRNPTEQERMAMLDLIDRLKALPVDTKDPELIQAEVYESGKIMGFNPLRLWFSALYEVLLGQSQGPRFGTFVSIFGIDNTIRLIEQSLMEKE